MIQAFPPVYSAVRFGDLARAAWAHVPPVTCEESASAALKHAYPSRHAMLMDSGTSALVSALSMTRREGVPPVVALPGFCCPDVGAAAIRAGYRVALYDVDPFSTAPDIPSLVSAVGSGATHVVIVHFYGIIQDVNAIVSAMGIPEVVVIEDAAQAAGGSLRGTPAGCQASIGILSFGRGKGINAGGGGALLLAPTFTTSHETPSPASVRASARDLVLVAGTSALSHPWLYGLPRALPWLRIGETNFVPADLPRGASLSVQALLPAAIAENKRALSGRRMRAAYYAAELSSQARVQVVDGQAGEEGGALRFAIRVSKVEQGMALDSLGRCGVVRSYPRTLAAYPEIQTVMVGSPTLLGAEELAATTFSLPTHEGIDRRVADHIVFRLSNNPIAGETVLSGRR